MQLIDFPNEILLKIISDSTILSTTDLLSLSLTGHRLSYLVLPQIYKSISLIDNPTKSNITQIFTSLNNILTTSPQRQLWLETAKFSWTRENVEDGLPWLTQAKMCGILKELPGLRSLGIGDKIQKSFTHDAIIPAGPSKLLLRHASSFQYLRHLVLDDFMTTTEDIMGFFTWPNLRHLTITNFIMLYSEETLSLEKKGLLAPRSNIQSLEFKKCHHNPFQPLLLKILQNQTQLRRLAVETTGYFQSAASIQWYLDPLRDALVELELTSLLQPRSLLACNNDQSILNLSEFKVLRKVEVMDHVLFSWPLDYIRSRAHLDWRWDSSHIVDMGLAARLPESLEFLTIHFENDHSAFKLYNTAEDNFEWVLSLANHRQANDSHRRLELILKESVPAFDCKSMVPVRWIPSRELEDIFMQARMGVRGLLRVDA